MRELQAIFNPKDGQLSHNELDQRKLLFHNLIINFVKEQHQKFLDDCNIRDFDPIVLQTWHSGFDMKTVPSINEFPMKEKPVYRVQTITDIIKDNDIKSKCILYAFEELNNQELTPHKNNEEKTNSDTLSTPNLSKVLSRSVYNKVKILF